MRFRLPSSALPTSMRIARKALLGAGLAAALALSACKDGAGAGATGASGIRFPDDAQITQALQANFGEDPNNAKARELIQVLGGEKGQLDYRIRRVIWRQGAFEAQYDVSLKMGQPGAVSLQKLYATMVPKDEAAKLPEQTLQAYEDWLKNNAATLEKSNPQQAQALRASLESLGQCYREAKPDDRVALMNGLGALISPAREGWYADRLQTPSVELRCLPL